MKKILASCAIALLAACVGCDNNGTPGGAGVSKNDSGRGLVSQPEETFSLSVPTLSTKLKQGETKSVTIGLKRGKNFSDDVHMKFDNVPKGVSIDPATPAIKASETECHLKIKVADDAAVGDFTVKVMGEPSKGAAATNDLKITVDKK
jgi:uncharacterized membrane protein